MQVGGKPIERVTAGYKSGMQNATFSIILTLWRNGSASDSRSEGCVFKSRQGQAECMEEETMVEMKSFTGAQDPLAF
ncbi:hypothetical protein NQZ68_016212 [Dissostichus eleginoides]|nr:hypothetical protein NQZ68_016212 [Dissostichus eleginoides]